MLGIPILIGNCMNVDSHQRCASHRDVFIRQALCLLAVTLIGLTCCDAQAADESSKKTLDGYLGAGAMSLPKYVGSADQVTRAVPLAMIEYKETIYIQLDRVGVRLWNTDDKKMAFGIAAQPRFGFHANDGARLSGMSTRRDSIEGGAVLEWELPQVSFNVAYFTDWSATSKGQSLHFSMARQLVDKGPWDLNAYISLDYADAKVVQYYFGVRADESTSTRPSYQPGATVISSLGFSGAYKLDKNYALLFGSEFTTLGAAADSPIVQRRTGLMGYLGLGLVF
jgi:outer membrane protein